MLALAGWLTVAGELSLAPGFAPPLGNGAEASWEQPSGWPVEGGHQYELGLELRGAPYVDWRVTARYLLADGTTLTRAVWPDSFRWRAPAPGPATCRARLVAPSAAASVQSAVQLQAKGNPHGRTAGLNRLVWSDLGPLDTLAEPPELLPNPGVETPPLAALLAPADKAPSVEDILAGTAAAGGEETVPDARVNGPPPGWPAEGFAVEQPELAHGGRRFFRLRCRERLLLSLAVVDVELPAIYRMGIWVRGQGEAAIRVRLSAAGYERLPDVESGSVRSGPEWREVTVEVPLALGDPRAVYLEMMLDIAVDGELDIDDASLRMIARGAAE